MKDDDKAAEKKRPPTGVDPGRDDGPLDSIGKAITEPIEGAAEPDEPPADGKKPPARPG